MNAKERIQLGYDLFNKHDMETFFKELVDENTTWTFPGKEGVHPLSGVHKGPQAMIGAFSKIPEKWSNFKVEPIEMISEGNKVFVRVNTRYPYGAQEKSGAEQSPSPWCIAFFTYGQEVLL